MKNSKIVFNTYFKEECKYLTDKDYERLDVLLSDYGCSPEMFCRFIMDTRKPEYIWPKWLLSTAVQEKFAEWTEKQSSSLPTRAALELERLYAGIKFEDDPVKFITSQNLEVSPLLRYLISKYLGLEEVAAKYRNIASQQLLEYPWYKKPFSKFSSFFPEEVPYVTSE